jgi:hypothetical protein
MDIFTPEQWLVVDFRDVTGKAGQTMDRATDFLDLPRFRHYPQVPHHNATRVDNSGVAPSAEDIRRLVDLYADELSEFSRLSGLDVSGWSTQRVIDGELDAAEFAETLSRRLGLIR